MFNEIVTYITDIFNSTYMSLNRYSLVLVFFVVIILMIAVNMNSPSSTQTTTTTSSSSSIFNSFSTSPSSFSFNDFLNSDSFVSKFAYLLLVIFIFMLLLRLSINILSYLYKPNDSPRLINGMVDATQMIVFPQDNSPTTIYRSNNENNGIEFTWSTWIFINNIDGDNNRNNNNMYKHVFSKGNSDLSGNGMVQPNNAPGLYIAPNTNTLVVVMNTYEVINEEITIPDIPLNKWVNVIIRCQNTTLDVYINGTITRSINLVGTPKQNYGDVLVGMNGGFNGYISNLWYYNYSLGTAEIQRIIDNGPNTKMIGSNILGNKLYDYLSLRWFYGSEM